LAHEPGLAALSRGPDGKKMTAFIREPDHLLKTSPLQILSFDTKMVSAIHWAVGKKCSHGVGLISVLGLFWSKIADPPNPLQSIFKFPNF
jgi:hypothetical protein